MKIIIFPVIFLILLSISVCAIPQIDSVDPTFSYGDSVSISGTGFGVKNGPRGAHPLFFDDFEIDNFTGEVPVHGSLITPSRHALTSDVPTAYSLTYPDMWAHAFQADNLTYTTDPLINLPGSTTCSENNMDDYYTNFQREAYLKWGTTDIILEDLFITFWVRFDLGTDYERHQIKLWRLESYDVEAMKFAQYNWGQTPDSVGSYYQHNTGSRTETYSFGSYPQEEWVQVRLQAHQSGNGVGDGSIEAWHSRALGSDVPMVKIIDLHNIVTRATQHYWDRVYIGEACTNLDHTAVTCEAIQHFDNFYLDNSWARIGICDKGTYESSAKCGIQVPETWSDGRITFTAKQSPFFEGDAAYLYVVDADGVMNEIGYEISFGAAPPCTEGAPRPCATGELGICATGEQTCSGGVWGECTQTVFPEEEICDSTLDDDCDGLTDCADTEDCESDPACIVPTCDDGTEYGQCSPTQPVFCSEGTLIDDCATCDCLGAADTCEADGSCTACVPEQEICDNGIDDDCDGSADCDDDECALEPVCLVSCNALNITIGSDDEYDLYLNGTLIGEDHSYRAWADAETYSAELQSGENVLAVMGDNSEGGAKGIIMDADYCGNKILSDNSWKTSATLETGWETTAFDDSAWEDAIDYGAYGVSPWNIGITGFPVDSTALWIWASEGEIAYARKIFSVSIPVVVDFQACTISFGTINVCAAEKLQYQYDSDTSLTNVIAALSPSVSYSILIENLTQDTNSIIAQSTTNEGILEFTP